MGTDEDDADDADTDAQLKEKDDDWTAVVPARKSKQQQRDRQQPQIVSSSLPAWIGELPVILPPTDNSSPTSAVIMFPLSVLLLVGLPGSGKSTLADALCRSMPWKYVRINQDELRSRGACQDAVRAALLVRPRRCPVVDRCNISRAQRRHFLLPPPAGAHDVPVPTDCIVLDVPAGTCIDRCRQRRHHPTVPPSRARQIVGWQQNEYQPPRPEEGFRSITVVKDDESLQRVIVDLITKKND